MNIVQTEAQRRLLQSIMVDISDVEQLTFASSLDPESKQQVLAEKLCQIRQTVLAGINDWQITVEILAGHKQGCMDSLGGFQGLLSGTLDDMDELGLVEPSDEQLQLLAMAARNYAGRVERYLTLRAEVELDRAETHLQVPEDGSVRPVTGIEEVCNG